MSLKDFSKVVKQLESWIYYMFVSTCLNFGWKLLIPCYEIGDLYSYTTFSTSILLLFVTHLVEQTFLQLLSFSLFIWI